MHLRSVGAREIIVGSLSGQNPACVKLERYLVNNHLPKPKPCKASLTFKFLAANTKNKNFYCHLGPSRYMHHLCIPTNF